MAKFWKWFNKYGFLILGISNLLCFNPFNAVIGIVFIIWFIVEKKNNEKDLEN